LKVPGLKELVRSYSFKTLSAHLAGKGYPGQQGEGGEEGECPPISIILFPFPVKVGCLTGTSSHSIFLGETFALLLTFKAVVRAIGNTIWYPDRSQGAILNKQPYIWLQ